MSYTPHSHDYLLKDHKIQKNERKTLWVVVLTFITMVVEIIFGVLTGSMALLADGWHMASHVLALGISLIAYKLARNKKFSSMFSFGTGKFVPLGGYTSALLLGVIAILMAIESFERYLNPVTINFNSAIWVACIGFMVNLVSVAILWDSHHHDEHVHDHNHKSALMHVIADTLTSFTAIIALLTGKVLGWSWADPIIGMVSSLIILKWAYNLCRGTMWELLDGHAKALDTNDLRELFNALDDVEITDLHVWRIAPNAHACEMVIHTNTIRSSDFYREIILSKFDIAHLIVEERCVT